MRVIAAFILVVVPATALADVIVPVSSPRLVYTTYAGTGPNSILRGLAVDPQGYAYLVGSGPGTGTLTCQFLTKLNQTGTAAVWSVCLPLAGVYNVAVDIAGNIYVVGANTDYSSGVIKLSPDAQRTIYSTKIDGALASSIALDRGGNVYISGTSGSTFKATLGAYMTSGGRAFAAKLNASGSLEYATYLDLFGGSIAVDSKGQAWIVGTTCPAKAGPVGSNCDTAIYGTAAAIRKLDASGTHLLAARSFGGGNGARFDGARFDYAAGVALDASDAAWIVGSVQTSFVPTTANALELQPPGTLNSQSSTIGYALKLASAGDLLYGTYVGDNSGSKRPIILSVAVDTQGRPSFALDLDTGGPGRGSTVMVLDSDGKSLLTSTYFGNLVENVALDGNGGLYLSGNTFSMPFFASLEAYQPVFPGGQNSGYAAKFDLTTPAPAAQFFGMGNAASLQIYPAAPVAPGEIVTLFGQNLPSNPKVTFDGRQAPILYADTKQINTVVPFEVSAPSTVVMLEGVRGYVLPVWPVVTGLFTADGSGQGQLAALNQDGTVNSSANPAKPGSVVAVYMTGAGAMVPPIADGQLGPLQPPYPAPVLGMSALINNSPGLANGIPATILFAGQAPGLIAGAVQVNVQIPASSPSGDVQLTIYMDGGYQTQIGRTTIAVSQ